MPLESLLELVHELRERIDVHGDALRQSEALTRYALIDPLLRELGWDTADPTHVVPEYRSGKMSADYALFAGTSPAMMVEAKKLGTPLRDDVLSQGIQYCLEKGTKHFSVTDGQRWEVYETHRPVPIDDKRIVSFDLKEQSSSEVCLKALALWRPAVEAGHVAAAESPIISSDGDAESQSGTDPKPAPPAPQPPSSSGWLPLSEWNPGQGDGKPTEMMFPDGDQTRTSHAYSVAVESVRWLVEHNLLTRNHCPITKDNRGKRNLVVDDLTLLQNRGTNDYKQVGGLYIDVKFNGYVHAKNARTIVERAKQDPADFKVRFD